MLTNETVQKIERLFQQPLIGDSLSLSDEERLSLFDELGSILRRISDTWGEGIKESEFKVVVATLVELTKGWDADEEGWIESLSKRLLGSELIQGKQYKELRKCVDVLANRGEMFTLRCYTKYFYASVCCHAFSPKKSMFSFFDLCWEIYCKDLFQQYEGNHDVLKLISNSLHNKISGNITEDEDIKIGSKVYGFRAGIKGLAIEKPDLLEIVLNKSLETIHRLMNSEPTDSDSYLVSLIRQWWKDKSAVFGQRTNKTPRKREYIAPDYSQIKAKYVLERGCPKLVIFPFRLLDHLDYEPYIEIKVNGETFQKGPIPTFGSGVIMTTKPVEYDLNEFDLKNIVEVSAEITHLSQTIFESKGSLKRDFILFAGDRESNAKSLVPGTYLLYAPDIRELKTPEDIQRVNGNLFSFSAKEGDVLSSGSRVVFFESEKSGRKIYFLARERTDACYRQEGLTYSMVDGDVCVCTEKNSDVTDFGVKIGGEIKRLSEFRSFASDTEIRYVISDDIPFGEPKEIVLFQYSDNRIVSTTQVIRFEDISVTYDKTIYYGPEFSGSVVFKTKRYCVDGKIDISLEENVIPFCEGEIVLLPPSLRWRIDHNEWHIKPSLAVFYKDLANSSLLNIELPLDSNYLVALGSKVLTRTTDGKYSELGRLAYSLADTSTLRESPLFLRVADLPPFELTRIVFKPEFLDGLDPVIVDSKKKEVTWIPSGYIGGKSLDATKLKVLDESGLTKVEFGLPLDASMTFALDDLEDGYYDIQVVGICGGFLRKEEILKEYKRCLLGDIKNLRFKNKILKINQALVFTERDRRKLMPIRPFYLSDFKYLFTDEYGMDVYSCRMFTPTSNGGRNYIQSVKCPDGEIKRINPIRMTLKTSRSCYLGYGLDESNAIDPDGYEGEFAVMPDGKTTIRKKGLGVDFYCFEIE